MQLKLADLVDIALAGGHEVMTVYKEGGTVEDKADGSPVTEADVRCEAVILKGLEGLAPGVPVVAEEAASAGRVPQTCERFFLVDPLDGTKEFINRNGEFTVNIALVEAGVPVAGIVYAPALGLLYLGSRAGGAFKAEVAADGRLGPKQPIAVRPTPERIVAVGSRNHGSAETAEWLRRFDVERFASRGSSLKFCLVAEGEADVYPRLGRTMEWDTAAGDAVLRAAGGTVTTLGGAPLAYGKRDQVGDSDFANPWFVAWGDPDLSTQAVPSTGPRRS
ncbi:3'(2'),5'-bisphosphate nucleotidase CysQ [Consotaella sp. CSK11QG-6]